MKKLAKRKRITPAATVRLKAYNIISDAVELGVSYGLTRAYKHTNEPDSNYIAEQVENAVMGQLCEVLDFDPERDDSAL
jgi:hypothetical protein